MTNELLIKEFGIVDNSEKQIQFLFHYLDEHLHKIILQDLEQVEKKE